MARRLKRTRSARIARERRKPLLIVDPVKWPYERWPRLWEELTWPGRRALFRRRDWGKINLMDLIGKSLGVWNPIARASRRLRLGSKFPDESNGDLYPREAESVLVFSEPG